MTSNSPSTVRTTSSALTFDVSPSLCWRAIIGGTVAAIGIHILLTALGVGAGLATFTPTDDANPVETFSIGAAVVWSICALVSLWFGGFLAGRFSHSIHHGFVHGVLVWCLTLIITLLLLTMGTGMVLGGAVRVLGSGLGIGGQAAAPAVGEMVKDATQRSSMQIESFVEEAINAGPSNPTPKATVRAQREIRFAVARFFAAGADVNSPESRKAATQALVAHAGMSEPEASKTVDEWVVSYNNLQAELERLKAQAAKKAKEVADRAATNLSHAALWSFFALLVGLLVSALGGSFGGGRAVALRTRHGDSITS